MDAKKGLLMFALVMFAAFIGAFLGEVSMNVPGLNWLGKSYEIGFSTFDLNLFLFKVTLGMQIKVCIAEVIMLLTALLCYNKLAKLIFG